MISKTMKVQINSTGMGVVTVIDLSAEKFGVKPDQADCIALLTEALVGCIKDYAEDTGDTIDAIHNKIVDKITELEHNEDLKVFRYQRYNK